MCSKFDIISLRYHGAGVKWKLILYVPVAVEWDIEEFE